MRKILTLSMLWLFTITVLWASNTKFVPVRLSQDEINYLMKDLESKNKEYDESIWIVVSSSIRQESLWNMR